ncbi:type I restriction enzyme HsdR N-terminal domain-containing protein [Aliarcobacter butzleri]|uniref:Uncharacterized protein n=1 Tax=Aliarcobacter butzleri L351 TaxID=1447259 RepID=A0A837J7N1_9BACT|nr:hypothetical protein [Aliarcobacter butzleri]KLE02195.1 hypothetical protein AF76_02845 [Aliarcobacter butzleri L351]KLE13426.1 hypothetical protein AF75_03635 [Aliarcobacter butzleri L350]
MKVEALQLSTLEVLERIRKNLCIISNIPLKIGETIISKVEFQNFLSNTINKKEKLLINRIVYTFARDIREFERIFNSTDKNKVKKFLLMIISKTCFLDEITLQVYLYFFWDELKWHGFYEEIKPDIKLFESLCLDKENSFCKEVSENITDTCDIVIFEEERQRVVLCEVKHGTIDDRAVAQIQRYYRKTKQFIELGVYSNSIINIKPILICNNIPLKRWLTFPTYFRELIDVFTYEVDMIENELKLINLKASIFKEHRKGLLSHINETVKYSK